MNYPRKVYAIRHNATNRVYIGSSCNVDRRFKQHLYALRTHTHSVLDMQKDFNEHGEDFTLTVLDTIKDASEANKEYEWMDKYQSFVREVGYNYKDLNRRRKGKAMSEDDAPLIDSRGLTENERELLDILHGAEDPTKTLYFMISMLTVFLNPSLAQEWIDIATGNTDKHPCIL